MVILNVIHIGRVLKYSLASLMLVPIAWVVSLLIAAHIQVGAPNPPARYDLVARRVEEVSKWATERLRYYGKNDNASEGDYLIVQASLGQARDPWGNLYQFVEYKEFDLAGSDEVGIYSMGEDGKSETNGRDEDDINSWCQHSASYYDAIGEQQARTRILARTVWLTPIVFVATYLLKATIGRAFSTNRG